MSIRPLLPPPLMKAKHLAAFDAIIRNYIGNDSDLTGVPPIWYYATVLNFDTVPAAILPYLAVMFGVDGYKGFDYAPTEDLQRQTLKNALLMKRRHGTKWALQTALENAGFTNVVIDDHLDVFYFDGSWQFDGSHSFDSNFWADFTISMDPPAGVPPQDVNIPALLILIYYWKRTCTRLISITINQLVITDFGIGDAVLYFDGSWQFDGSETFNGVGA